MKRLAIAIALAAAALAAVGGSSARDQRGSAQSLAAAADAVVAAGVPGVVVYSRRGSHTTVVARGYADLATKRPVTAFDRFRIGSVTKSFVATVVMQLVHERKLALDDTIEQHLPGLVPNGDSITIRRLLSHTSGLADYFSNKRIYAPYAAGNFTYVSSHLAIVRISTRDKPLFAPGAPGHWAYSNTGYYLLGLTIERITGHTLGAELTRRIFRPLGLTHTTLPSTPALPAPYAHGYTPAGGKLQDISHVSPSILWAAGAIVSTPTDVAAFYRALFQGRLVPLRLVHQMQSAQYRFPAQHGERLAVGLGLFQGHRFCVANWGHGGDLPGYSTTAFNSPDGTRQAVVMANAGEEGTLSAAARNALGALEEVAFCG